MLIPNWIAPKNIQAFTYLPADPIFNIPFPLKQVHGKKALILPYESNATPPEADAVFTRTPNTICAIRTADCLPILVTSMQGNEVAAIHAGWKGLIAGVIEETFTHLHSTPKDCIAWIGPAICGKCFEVGPEVREAFINSNTRFAHAFTPGLVDKYFGNLPQIAEMILSDLGVETISQSDVCTVENLHCNSYRREHGSDQRMVTGISFTETS